MRFVFHNPNDIYWYKPSIMSVLRNKKSAQKYSYLLDFFLESSGKIYVYLDNHKSDKRHIVHKFLPPFTGFYIWALINRINPLRIRIITDPEKVYCDDVFFMFLWDNFTSRTGDISKNRQICNELIAKITAFKVVHLTHYSYNANLGSLRTKEAKIDLFVSENNLFKNSEFFQTTFNWYGKNLYTLPFVPNEKFRKLKAFEDRKNKALATGTITFPMEDNCFLSFFKHSQLQPMRNEIYQKRMDIVEFIDSIISPIHNGFDAKQEKYFSYDIVQMYNDYKMFVVPEEVCDLPGIGFVEGMKCGSAFIGINDPMYTEIGLIDGVNYIAYDGTFDGLLNKIKYYQENQIELELIARNGYEFVTNTFTKEKIAGKFLKDINELVINK